MTDELISRKAAIDACRTQMTKFADATKSDWERGNDSGALGCTYAIRAIPAADTSALGAVVKPLVWHTYDVWTHWAESTSGTYRVQERNGVWRTSLLLPQTEHIVYEYDADDTTPADFEAAQLAAQADHAARILAALEPPTHAALDAAEARERQAVEACAKVRVAAPSEAPNRLDYYTFKRGWDAGISAKNAAIRTVAKP